MTKARDPSSFPDAVMQAVGALRVRILAELLGLSERAVYNWGDPDTQTLPNLDQALAIDRAYVEAGLGEAPILTAYREQLEQAEAPAHEPGEPFDRSLAALRAFTDAQHAYAEVATGTPSVTVLLAALQTLEEARGSLDDMTKDLVAMLDRLRGSGAGDDVPIDNGGKVR